jgi:hypothetical protein
MKNDGTYFIAYQYSAGIIKKYYPPQIHPFEWQGIEFFVHRVLDGTKDNKPLYSTMFWQVSEKTTGKSLSIEGATTLTGAELLAKDKLKEIGVAKVKEVIAKAKGE